MFRGIFIGIDRHASTSINWLSCACRDAVAMHALFTDNLAGETVLLRDSDATRAGIEAQFKKLETCEPEDFVVIAFSGHGTETHELVTYDADPADFKRSCIPLDVLAEWIARIPARNLMFVLDCCFSGGSGRRPFGLKQNLAISPARRRFSTKCPAMAD
jgi:helicase